MSFASRNDHEPLETSDRILWLELKLSPSGSVLDVWPPVCGAILIVVETLWGGAWVKGGSLKVTPASGTSLWFLFPAYPAVGSANIFLA